MDYQPTSGMRPDGEGRGNKIQRRSRLEMRMDILQIVLNGIEEPTQIMYRANLSWFFLSENLKALIDLGFVNQTPLGKRKRYVLTEKGIYVVKDYLDVVRAIETSDTEAAQAKFSF